jgi:F-type H+-transporting ATPase subunit delta
MMDHRAAARYARAVFELAQKAESLDAVERDLEWVRGLIEKHGEILHLLVNSSIPLAEKQDFLVKVLPSDLQPLTLYFLKTLIKKRRFAEFSFIQKAFHERYEIAKGIQEVTATTVLPMSRTIREKLIDLLQRKLKQEVRLFEKVDSSIVGGTVGSFWRQSDRRQLPDPAGRNRTTA